MRIRDWSSDVCSSDLPWASAWRLIEEGWAEEPTEEGPTIAVYNIRDRLRGGDRSNSIVNAIVNLVTPRLRVEPVDYLYWHLAKIPRKPKAVEHLLSARIVSGSLVDLDILELESLTEVSFLTALASALESAVNRGLNIANRLGYNAETQLWRLGELYRARYVEAISGARSEEHTSELQSLMRNSYAVFCLKKKNNKTSQ